MPILLPEGVDKLAFMTAMKAQGIQTSWHYPPVHTFKAYTKEWAQHDLSQTENIAAREVTLPLYPTMTNEQSCMVIVATAISLLLESKGHN